MTSPIDKLREHLEWISTSQAMTKGGDEHYWRDEVDRHAKESLSLLDTLTPSEAWQPIETAPRDGTVVFLFDPKTGHSPDWMVTGWYDEKLGWRACDSIGQRSINSATHWQSLPPPPKKEK